MSILEGPADKSGSGSGLSTLPHTGEAVASGGEEKEEEETFPKENPPGMGTVSARSAREAAAVASAKSGSSGYRDDSRLRDRLLKWKSSLDPEGEPLFSSSLSLNLVGTMYVSSLSCCVLDAAMALRSVEDDVEMRRIVLEARASDGM